MARSAPTASLYQQPGGGLNHSLLLIGIAVVAVLTAIGWGFLAWMAISWLLG